jgi:hypothetical protein
MSWRVGRFLSRDFQPPQLKVQINLHKLLQGILLQGVTWQIAAHFIVWVELSNLGDVLIKIITELGGLLPGPFTVVPGGFIMLASIQQL